MASSNFAKGILVDRNILLKYKNNGKNHGEQRRILYKFGHWYYWWGMLPLRRLYTHDTLSVTILETTVCNNKKWKGGWWRERSRGDKEKTNKNKNKKNKKKRRRRRTNNTATRTRRTKNRKNKKKVCPRGRQGREHGRRQEENWGHWWPEMYIAEWCWTLYDWNPNQEQHCDKKNPQLYYEQPCNLSV